MTSIKAYTILGPYIARNAARRTVQISAMGKINALAWLSMIVYGDVPGATTVQHPKKNSWEKRKQEAHVQTCRKR